MSVICHNALPIVVTVSSLFKLLSPTFHITTMAKTKRGAQGKNKKDASEPVSKKAKTSTNSKSSSNDSSNDSSSNGSKAEAEPTITGEFTSDACTPDGNKWNFKIVSWNVNGIRAWVGKDGLSVMKKEEPDIICLQEIKCSKDKMPGDVTNMKGYKSYFMPAKKDGYSGVGLLSKREPLAVTYGFNDAEHDDEGRTLTAEYDNFFLVNAYVPNSGRGLVSLDKRMDWEQKFRAHLTALDAKKPVILCGDLNVAHEEIDLANPKNNRKNAGFTKEERESFTTLLDEGFLDSYRTLYPTKTGQYTFWTYMMNSRAKNVGWRLDYFVLSARLRSSLCDNLIRSSLMGSDHCPITLLMHFLEKKT